MTGQSAAIMNDTVKAHAASREEDFARWRGLSMRERAALIEQACEAAATTERDRIAAGLPAVKPAPWPASTWEFLRKHAARVRS